MTHEQFLTVKIGDRIELLNLDLKRIGQFFIVTKITKAGGLWWRDKTKKSGWSKCSNPARVAFPQ